MNKNRILLLLFILFSQNLSYSQINPLSIDEVDNLIHKGNKYFRSADFVNSLKTMGLALKNAKLIKNDSLAGYACNRIARNFTELYEIDKAIHFYNNGLIYANNSKNDNLKTTIYINLGNLFTLGNFQDLNKGLYYYNKALDYSIKINDIENIIIIKMDIAWCYFSENKFDLGFPYLKYCNENYNKNRDTDLQISINMLNGMYYSFKNENDKAQNYFLKGINSSNNIILKEDKQYLFLEYSKFLNKIGDHKKAFQNLQAYNQINDSLFDRDKIIKAIRTGIEVEIDDYKTDLNLVKFKQGVQEQNLYNSKIINILAFMITVIMASLLILVFKNFKQNKKSNDLLIAKNKQLNLAIEKSNEDSNIKSQFISTISHELRTPLYGVIGLTDIICDEYKNTINDIHLESLKFSASYLLSLVNDILQISKIEDSKIVLEKNTFNLQFEIIAIQNSLQFIANKNNVKLKFEIDSNIPNLIVGDQIRLAQILMNLITNALKFTINGNVLISVTLAKFENEFNFIKFVIEDTGIGIAKENQSKIFDKFTQIDRNNEDYQGTGLGLSIVKRLITLFRSEIFLESEINKGSKFIFTIPFKTGKLEDKNKNNIKILTDDIPLNILIVEDNKINQLVTKKIISIKNHIPTIVSNGFEAIEIVKKQNFDIILMDINMPGLNGFETSIKIRELFIETPIIALTAFNRKQIGQQANISGINEILVKPFNPEDLFKIIYNLRKELP